MSSITFHDIYALSKLGRTEFETFLERKINYRGWGVIVGGDRGGSYLFSERIIKVLMECSINNSRGGILSFSRIICAS